MSYKVYYLSPCGNKYISSGACTENRDRSDAFRQCLSKPPRSNSHQSSLRTKIARPETFNPARNNAKPQGPEVVNPEVIRTQALTYPTRLFAPSFLGVVDETLFMPMMGGWPVALFQFNCCLMNRCRMSRSMPILLASHLPFLHRLLPRYRPQ